MTKTDTEMRRSWLVQRLEKPRESSFLGMKDNPFSFGGGLRNGGLSTDAMDLLRPILAFEYMGAAEFEFGAVPKALSGIAEARGRRGRGLVATSFTIPLSRVKAGWRTPKDAAPLSGDATIYLVARPAHLEEAQQRITSWATGKEELKEWTGLSRTLRAEDEYGRTVGWLELDNGFMFFVDEEMWQQVCGLFEVKTSVATS